MDDEGEPGPAGSDEARHRHVGDDIKALADDGITLARAEFELQKARAIYAAGRLWRIALAGMLAAVLAFFSLVALTVGLVVALVPPLGALGATLAVFGGLLLVGLLCAVIAALQWKRMFRALSNPEARDGE
jgi:uncharacterized membrane protein YqjE